jgi:hypothetical protein
LAGGERATDVFTMKSHIYRGLILLLAICALLIAPAGTSFARSPAGGGGRFVVKFSPILGDFVGLSVTIDGGEARPLTKGHVFEQDLPAGPHKISVYRNGRLIDAWHGTVNVRPGQTYSYVVKYSVDQLVLERVSGS